MSKFVRIRLAAFANDNDPLSPEVWAQESLMILEANMVASALVYRDFSNEVARFGDVVNCHRPGTFANKRKVDGDDVTVQDATATNVAVTLNQHNHISFMIYDGEESKSFVELVNMYLRPAVMGAAQALDEIVLGERYNFLGNVVGKLDTDVDKAAVIAARELLSVNKCPLLGRNVIVSPDSEGALLNIDAFVNAEKVGDAGTALREGSIGRKFGMNFWMDQNCNTVATGSTTVTGAVNNVGGYAAGTTSLTVDGLSAAITAGTWCTIAGDMTPQKITGTTGGATPTAMVISPGLASAVANDAVITIYTPGAVNLSAGYAANWSKPLVIDGFSVAPKIGQMIDIGGYKYAGMTTPTTTSLTLTRGLDATAANDAVVGVGPAGNYNWAFHPNAVALVTRPLAMPRAGTGVQSSVVSYNGLTLRVCISYDPYKQGHLVTVDFLAGVKTLDTNLGCLILG